MKKHLLTISLFLYTITGFADCNPDALSCINTTQGALEQVTRSHSGDGYSHLMLNGKEIYKSKDSYLGMDNYNVVQKGKKHVIDKIIISFSSNDPCYPDKPSAPCDKNVVLDLTKEKPIISNEFFAYYGPSQITWVSWGRANSIIVIDDYLRFKYANGHVEQVTKVKDAAGTSIEGK